MKKELIELGNRICELIGEQYVEDIVGVGIVREETNITERYRLDEELDEGFEDEDKEYYQNGSIVYSVSRLVGDNKEKVDGLFTRQDCTRSGDYWSDYEYEFYKPEVVELKQVVVDRYINAIEE